MRYKLIWHVNDQGPVVPEIFDADAPAKARAKQLLFEYGPQVAINVWNEDETWRMVAPVGVAEWCRTE